MELTLPNKKECIGETKFMFNPLIIATMVNQNVAFAELSMDEMTTVEGGLVLEFAAFNSRYTKGFLVELLMGCSDNKSIVAFL